MANEALMGISTNELLQLLKQGAPSGAPASEEEKRDKLIAEEGARLEKKAEEGEGDIDAFGNKNPRIDPTKPEEGLKDVGITPVGTLIKDAVEGATAASEGDFLGAFAGLVGVLPMVDKEVAESMFILLKRAEDTGLVGKKEASELKKLVESNPKEAVKQGVSQNKRGDILFEISDQDVTTKPAARDLLRTMGRDKVDNLIEHPELFKALPGLKDVNVKFVPKKEGAVGGSSFDPEGNTITLAVDRKGDPKKAMASLLHEMQHAVQQVEKLPLGGDPDFIGKKAGLSKEDAVSFYTSLVGEVEARDVAGRFLRGEKPGQGIPATSTILDEGRFEDLPFTEGSPRRVFPKDQEVEFTAPEGRLK